MVTLVLSIIGAATGIAALAWNIISFRLEGPLISIRATCSGRGADLKIAGTVRNRGRFDANLESAWLCWSGPPKQIVRSPGSPTWVASAMSVEIPSTNITNLTIPGLLPAENGQEFVITDIEPIDIGLTVALHDRRVVVFEIRTASGRRVKKTIRYA